MVAYGKSYQYHHRQTKINIPLPCWLIFVVYLSLYVIADLCYLLFRPEVMTTAPSFHQELSTPPHTASAMGGGLLNSPVHSIAESTPTHTEYTEGTPSFTTSSPSCSSDMLGMIPFLSSFHCYSLSPCYCCYWQHLKHFSNTSNIYCIM